MEVSGQVLGERVPSGSLHRERLFMLSVTSNPPLEVLKVSANS
jgi:hypothetical protein